MLYIKCLVYYKFIVNSGLLLLNRYFGKKTDYVYLFIKIIVIVRIEIINNISYLLNIVLEILYIVIFLVFIIF